ncbi:hypothetical protein [Leptospira johnsonii]|uniref:Uncharacterized protein n=1 Tax=Leptospira johnsonii TaxID=1917820 RepID=A0A2P2D7R5_9LEPT|nr:hypothetical protein [Leptospira johnsonii]GBF40673.1 hypothetical protein LPTSP1_36910 [Leptospira johnsonii]
MKFTSIKQIPKEAIEMIDDVQWWYLLESYEPSAYNFLREMPERMGSDNILIICNNLSSDGIVRFGGQVGLINYYYIEPRELEDKTYGINLYKKIHGEGK